MPTVNSKDVKTTTILANKADWLPWKTQTILAVTCEGIPTILTDSTHNNGRNWSMKNCAEAYRIIHRTLAPLLQTEISHFIQTPWDAFAALQRKFEAFTDDDLQTLEAKLNRITQERNETYATLISRLNTSVVKFKNAGGEKSDKSLCAILRQAISEENQTVKITLKTPAMINMYYDELTTYLTALDPDDTSTTTTVQGAHQATIKDNCAFCKKHGHNIDQCHTLQKIVKIASGKQRNQDHDRYQPYDRRFDKDDSKYDRRDYKPSDRHNREYDSDRDYQPRNYDNRDDHRRKDYDRRDNRNDRSSHHRRDTRDNGNWEYSKNRAMAALAKYQAENRKIAFSAIKPTSDHRDSD